MTAGTPSPNSHERRPACSPRAMKHEPVVAVGRVRCSSVLVHDNAMVLEGPVSMRTGSAQTGQGRTFPYPGSMLSCARVRTFLAKAECRRLEGCRQGGGRLHGVRYPRKPHAPGLRDDVRRFTAPVASASADRCGFSRSRSRGTAPVSVAGVGRSSACESRR